MATTKYHVVAWSDHQRRDQAPQPTTREYGTASFEQAATRLAQRVLPPDADYTITTLHRTVHHGHTARTDPPPRRTR